MYFPQVNVGNSYNNYDSDLSAHLRPLDVGNIEEMILTCPCICGRYMSGILRK